MSRSIRIALMALLALVLYHPAAKAQVAISVSFGPPALPVYDQPLCPGDGYLWDPGYWAWDDDDQDYYWVPGTWVMAPEPGFLWTPAWWGWDGGVFLFHEGYWATEVGFYGGINYGFGYFGHGFWGGRWDHDHFFYNRAVFNVNETVVHNVYEDRTVIRNVDVSNHISYNGGEGGINERPTSQEQAVEHERHIAPVAEQTHHIQAARSNPQMRASANQGRPPVAATARPGELTGHDAVAAKAPGAPYHPPANRNGGRAMEPGGNRGGPPAINVPGHARDIQPHRMPQIQSSGNSAADTKYQQQQQKLIDKQNAEHQKLQQQQEAEHQRAQQQQWNQPKQQQMEQHHQQQTQQLEQRHTQQQQNLERRAPAPAPRRPH